MMRFLQRGLCAFVVCTVVCSMEFTTPKKKRGGPTAAQLTADIADELKSTMCQLFELVDDITAHQRAIITVMEDALEQDKDGFFARASREQLQQFSDELKQHRAFVASLHDTMYAATQSVQVRLRDKKKS